MRIIGGLNRAFGTIPFGNLPTRHPKVLERIQAEKGVKASIAKAAAGLIEDGGMELDLSWKNGQLDEYTLRPGRTKAIVRYNGKTLRTVHPE